MMSLNNFVGEDISFHRSGSAPPTVEGSLNAINELNSGEIGSDPDYLSYYYNSVTRNPRMPAPVLSKEDWRSRQRFGGIEHNRNLSQNLGVNSSRSIGRNDNVWVSGDGLFGLPLPNQESLTGFLQDDTNQSTSNPHYSFLPASQDAYETNNVNCCFETRFPIHTDRNIQNSELQNKTFQSFASDVTPLHLNRRSELVESENLVAALGKLNLSSDVSETSQLSFSRELRNIHSQISRGSNPSHSVKSSIRGPSNSSNFPSHVIDSRLYASAGGSAASLYQDYDINELDGYSINPNLIPAGNLPPLLESAVNASSIAAFTPRTNVTDPQYQFLKILEYASLTGQSYYDLLKMRQYGSQFPGNNGYNLNTSYPSKLARHTEHNLHFHRGMDNYFGGGSMSSRTNANGCIKECFPSSLLEEFKLNKTKCLELSDIAGSVIEFSTDQRGSRFIQHKLDSATVEEINMLFKEIIPQALALMTDVFGNYVIQKLFELGSSQQIRELTSKLYSNVLDLSLQMYGCRVIQKAIEIVDFDQQTKMAAELDGHIMRCVRDQNGNHVIQKCIQCIPEEDIQFIISSFYDNIITLSTHPYGCRVIQRVLEHCNDPKTQKIVIDEVMKCVSMLAWDQYGNYVVQHVVKHGKPHERSAIIKQLAGQIIQMSQQKYASNVVEKCLTFSTPDERQMLVNEMLGTTDDNEPLQVMMKDQFGNYVVQKVLETCNEKQRQLILSRIKVHLTVLKKYTYGKHIVARVEKLLTAGERRNALQSTNHLNMA